MTTVELVALVSESPRSADTTDDDDSSDEVEEFVQAPSLIERGRQLKGFAAFMADNSQFSAADEMVLQRYSDRVAKMLVSRVNHRRQQNITSYCSAA